MIHQVKYTTPTNTYAQTQNSRSKTNPCFMSDDHPWVSKQEDLKDSCQMIFKQASLEKGEDDAQPVSLCKPKLRAKSVKTYYALD